MFKWGVLSGAKIGIEHLIPAIAESSNGIISGIACRNRDDAVNIASQFNIEHTFDDYEALLASPDIDGIYLPIATSHHVYWTKRAAEAGKHVLCEKPIAMTAEEVDELITLRDKTGLLISEAFMVYYHPQWQKVKRLIADGAIGSLTHIQAGFSFYTVDPKNTRNDPALGGGALRDLGVYPVVTARLATGKEPLRVRAEIQFSEEFGVDYFTNATLQFDGFSMTFYCSTQLSLYQDMGFHGDKGRIHLSAPFNAELYDHSRVHIYNENDKTETSFIYHDVRQYRLEVEAFVKAVNDRNTDHCSLENSRANQRIIDALFEAGQSGDWVYI